MIHQPDALLTTLALRQVAERYAMAVDRGDGEMFAAQFTEDGVLESPRGSFAGRAMLRTVPPMMRQRYDRTFHAVLNLSAEIAAGTATAETYCIARHFFRDGMDQDLCYEMTIRYQDRFERRADAWLIARRELVVDATRTFPVDRPPAA